MTERPPSTRCPDCQMFVPNLGRHQIATHPKSGNFGYEILVAKLREENYQQAAYITVLEQAVRDEMTDASDEEKQFHVDALRAIAELESGFYWMDDDLNRRLSEKANG